MDNVLGLAIDLLKGLNLFSVCIRLVLSMLCGGAIGVERGRSNQPAGMRTYMLVCMGSAIVMMTGQYMFYEFQSGDPARLGAQVVSGIGFLGAGSIIISGKTRVRGLTTAAGIWAAACIGLSIGIGFYECGIGATFAVYLIISQFRKIENRFTFSDTWVSIYVEMDDIGDVPGIYEKSKSMGMVVGDVQIIKKGKNFRGANIDLRNDKRLDREVILSKLTETKGLQVIKFTS